MKKATLFNTAMLLLATGLAARFVPSSVFEGVFTHTHTQDSEKEEFMSVVNACGELTEVAIGTLNGSASFEACNPGVISVGANGVPSSSSDVQYMVQREVCGNGELIVLVQSVSGGKAGLELRADNAPGAVKAGLKTNLSNFVDRIVRTQPNAAESSQQLSAPGRPWLKIVRNGNSVITYTSSNGSNWTQAAAYTLSLPTCIQAGVLMQSVNNATTHTGTFSNLTFSGFSLPSGPATTLSFAADTLQANAGDTVQVCVNITDPCACSPSSVQVALQGSGSPHLAAYSTQTLQFQNGDTQKCFSLPAAAAPGNGTYILSLQNATGGNGASAVTPNSVVINITNTDDDVALLHCGLAPPMDRSAFPDEYTIAFDHFGNEYSYSQLLSQTSSSNSLLPSSNLGFPECDCEDLGIDLNIFDLFFEDCLFDTGEGFAAPGQLGEDRRRTLCAVYQYLETLIATNTSLCVPGVQRIVNIRVQPSIQLTGYFGGLLPEMEENVQGYASAYYPYTTLPGISQGMPQIIINSGEYPASVTAQMMHGFMRINFNFDWHTNFEENIPGVTTTPLFDLYTVGLHEALHLLGFASSFLNDDAVLPGSGSNAGRYFPFDRFLLLDRNSGEPFIVNDPPEANSGFLASPIWRTNNSITPQDIIFRSCRTDQTRLDVLFQGDEGLYPVFTGPSLLTGRSFSHFEGACGVVVPNAQNTTPYVMNPALPRNTQRRVLHPHERDAMVRIGYNIGGTRCVVGAASDGYGEDDCSLEMLTYRICPENSTYSVRIPLAQLFGNDPNAVDIAFIVPLNGFSGTGVFNAGRTEYIFTTNYPGIHEFYYVPIGCNNQGNHQDGNIAVFRINIIPDNNEECEITCPPVLSCAEVELPEGWEYCEEHFDCLELTPCNLLCNGSFCGTVFAESENAPGLANELGPDPKTLINTVLENAGSIVPGWIRTGGTPDYFMEGIGTPNSIGLATFVQRNSTEEGIMAHVPISSGRGYLFSMVMGPVNAAFANRRSIEVNLIIGEDLIPGGTNITDAPHIYTGPTQTIFSAQGGHPAPQYRVGNCFIPDRDFSSFWVRAPFVNGFLGTGIRTWSFVDNIELIEDNFSAGADQAIVCGEEALLGGAHCMLTDVGIQYQWFELDENGIPSTNPIASYRVRNNDMTDVQGAIDMTTRELLVSPLSTTSYLLRREIFDFGGLPATFEFCELEDIVTIFVEDNLPSAAFTYTETNCIADFSSLDPTPGLQHLWVFGNTGQTSTAQHPSGIALPEGVYLVTHTVTGPCGTDEQTLTIQNCCTAASPAATFGVSALDDCGLFGFRILTQGSGALTFTWNVDGQTYTGLEAEHTFTASGDYLLSLTVTNICGQSVVYTQNIEVKLPTADAAFSPFVYCLDAAFTPAHTDGAHLWDFGDGAVSSAATARHTYAAPGAYTVTHTYTEPLCGAQAVQTLSITVSECDLSNFSCPCTEPNSINIDAGNGELRLSDLIAAGIMPPGSVTLRCIAVRGTLRVDADYGLVSCEMRMQPGAGIVVQSHNTLILKTVSHNGGFYGCGQMWRGIRVEPQANLESVFSWIADAQYAVEALDKSNILLQSNTFRRNYTGLFFNAGGEFNLENFADNTIDGADPLLPPFAGQTPAPGTRPFAGVDVTGQSNLSIGVAGAQPNRFLHLRNGIITNNTNTEIRNSTFEGILRVNTEPNYPFTGFAVRHSGGAAHALTLEGLGKNAAATFHNCTEGVWATGTDVDVQEARMTGMSIGVTVQQAAERVVEVYNNNISATARGIQVLQSPQTARISIRGNEVTAGLAPPLFSKAIAIRADGSSAVQGAEIRNNEVATLGSDLGISVNACAGFEVDDNEVDVLSADNAQGILMAGGTDNILSNNTVTGLLGTGNGVWLNGAGNIRLWCNTLSKLGMGLQLSGQHSGADIATTLFRTPMGTGLRYVNGVLAPQQNGRGNRWEGTGQDYSVAAARHEGGSEQVILNNQYRVHEGYNPNLNFNFFPPSIVLPDPNVDPSTPWFEVDEEVGVETCIDQPQFQEEEEVVLLRRKIAQDSIASFAIGVQWDANMQLYLKLLQEPELLNQDTLWADFFARYNQTALGQLADLEKAKFALFAPSEESEQIALWKKDMKDWVAEVLVIDSFAAADSLYVIPAQRGVLLEDIAEAVEEMSRLNDAIKDRRMTLADSLLTQNAVITAIDDPAQNQYWTNAIYLYKLANDEFTFSSAEKETLDSIAAQCPELGGHAVFVARALRALYNDEVIEDSGDCDTATQSLRTAERTNTMQMQEIKEKVHSNVWADVRIFPNPASNSFTIAYNLTQPAEMRLYDIHGKMKVSRILPAIQAGREEIPVHQLLSGVYVVVVLTESGERFTTRLSIMR